MEVEQEGEKVKDWCHVFINAGGFLNDWKCEFTMIDFSIGSAADLDRAKYQGSPRLQGPAHAQRRVGQIL